jgi:hypothetical protein
MLQVQTENDGVSWYGRQLPGIGSSSWRKYHCRVRGSAERRWKINRLGKRRGKKGTI